VFSARSVPEIYKRHGKIAWSSGVPKNEENGDPAEYNGDEIIGIGRSEVVRGRNQENGNTTEYNGVREFN
jgi:hypothetical protein